MPKNSCIMQIWAEPEKSALPICNYSQILYQFLTFTQNLKRSRMFSQSAYFYFSIRSLIIFCLFSTKVRPWGSSILLAALTQSSIWNTSSTSILKYFEILSINSAEGVLSPRSILPTVFVLYPIAAARSSW